VEVGNEHLSGERSHGALKEFMMQVFRLHVAFRAAFGDTAVVLGTMGGEVTFMSSKLVEPTTCELL
jgi:hypothetical protein